MTGKFYAKIWKEEPCQFLWEEKYMDAIDYKILKILQKNARETASNISKEIIYRFLQSSRESVKWKKPE